MMAPPFKDDGRFRAAVPEDAPALALFVNMAGEGLPHYLWSRMATPGQSAWEVGCARARRDSGSFSWRNATLRVVEGEAVACLIGYPLDDGPVVSDYASMPPMFQPLQQLEDQACGTWYVNVLATREEHRGKGHGRALLELAEEFSRRHGRRGTSLIVADANLTARRLYARMGYGEVDRRPMVKEQWENPAREWVLMVKPLG